MDTLQLEKQNAHRCDVCRAYFSKSPFFTSNHAKRHILRPEPFDCQRNILESYACRFCPLEYDTIILLKEHVIRNHSTNKRLRNSFLVDKNCYICESCSFESYSYLHWFKHVLEEDEETDDLKNPKTKWFQCKKCEYKTMDARHLERHFNLRHVRNEGKKWFRCHKCTYKTTCSGSLKIHYVKKHTDDKTDRWFHCKRCTYKTKIQSCFKKHLKSCPLNKNKDAKWLECKKCTYKTKSSASFKGHSSKTHGDKTKSWFWCEQCTYRTTVENCLKKHLKSCSANTYHGKWFQCEKCSYKAAELRAVKIHFDKRHTNPFPFRCEKCSYKTAYKHDLKKHCKRVHVETKKISYTTLTNNYLEKCASETGTESYLRYLLTKD